MSPMLLELRDVSKNFDGVAALDGVSFTVEEGEVFGLIGPNGAGKTTLFHVVSALLPATRGRVLFRGRDLAGLRPHAVTERGIARTFQNIRLFDTMTVAENVMAGRHCRGGAGVIRSVLGTRRQRAEEAATRRRTAELLRLVGLSDASGALPGSLPYGRQRRLEIARALASDPSLLLLDEPAAGMNESETEDMFRLIGTIRAQGVTVLLIEHDMALVMRACDRIAVLNFGRRIALGTPAQVRNDPQVVEAYLGRDRDDGDA